MEKDKEALLDEEKRLVKLGRIVDLTSVLLWQANLTLCDAQKLIGGTREKALELFPDKGETFDLIYAPRFRRILSERFRLS